MRNATDRPETWLLEGYSRDEAILILSRQRALFSRKPIGGSTFYRWIGELGISPKYRYSEADITRLLKLCTHYAMGGSTANLPEI